MVPEIDIAYDQLLHTEKRFVRNQKPSQLTIYTFKLVCRYTFKHLEVNFKNLLRIELTNDLILLFLSLVNNISCCFFFVTGVGCEIECVGTIESNSILYISVRVTCPIKFKINESFKV